MPIKTYQELRNSPDMNKETFKKQHQNFIGAVTHMRGWRKTMEDANIFEFDIDGKGTNLFAVFDGHGGGEVAVYAQRHFKEYLINHSAYKTGDYQKALLQTFPFLDATMMTEKGSDEVFEIKQELDEVLRKQFRFEWEEDSEDDVECLAGSTAIVSLMTKDTIYIASLGDSRCIISSNGSCSILSIEHKPGLPEQKKRIEAAGGKVKNNRINGRLGMSRSLGDFQFKMRKNKPKDQQMVISIPHIDKIKNENIDFILIGCDGVWEGHSTEWYFNFVHEKIEDSQSPEKIIEEILDNVVAKSLDGDDGHDNMTAILLFLEGKNEQKSLSLEKLI